MGLISLMALKSKWALHLYMYVYSSSGLAYLRMTSPQTNGPEIKSRYVSIKFVHVIKRYQCVASVLIMKSWSSATEFTYMQIGQLFIHIGTQEIFLRRTLPNHNLSDWLECSLVSTHPALQLRCPCGWGGKVRYWLFPESGEWGVVGLQEVCYC